MLSADDARKATCAAVLCALALGLAEASQQPTRPAHPRPSQAAAPAGGVAAVALPEIYRDAIRENAAGIALMERHEFTEALPRFQRACILNPESDTGCLNIGIALLNMGHYDEAAKILLTSAERHPENPRTWFNLGLLERESGNLEVAKQDFEKATALDPDDPDTQFFLGYLAEESQHYNEAATAFENAISLDSAHVSAEYGLSQTEEHRGDIAGAKAHLARFQHLSASRLAKPIRFVYGEQGKYSLAQEMEIPPRPAPATIPVRFVDVTLVSGLAWRLTPAISRKTVRGEASEIKGRATAAPPEVAESALAEFLGSGACIFDYDGDGRPDVFLVNSNGQGDSALFRNTGKGSFVNVTKAAKLEFHGQGTGCAVGDYDNDGHPDLAISSANGIALFHNQGDGTFSDETDAAGVRTAGLVLGLAFLDYDGDGNLDLFAARFNDFPLDHAEQPFLFPDAPPPGNILWRNQGDGTFVDATEETSAAGNAPSVGAVATDVNNDRATDLVLTGWQKFPVLLLNSREGGFRATNPWAISMPGPTSGVVAFDFSHDGWMDLAFTHWASPGISVWRNVVGRSFQRLPLVGPGWMRGWGIAAIDYDNDGWIDLVAVGETFSGEGRIVLFRNEGSAGFRDATHETGLDKVVLHHPRTVLAFDFDGDGATDLLITQNDGPPVLLKNVGGNKNRWLELRVTGNPDHRLGGETRIDLFAGVERQTLQVAGASGYLGQGPAEVSAGLGREGAADVLRILWPSGSVQDEMQVPGGERRVAEGVKP
ncbi:MAG TPA: FG-GAP-like repeat-containing protein [Candidatus Acidoferrales bacterium]|nr:FG-GAP-like repeat-containing protein [Candidatus Acidoferrales bacterium]